MNLLENELARAGMSRVGEDPTDDGYYTIIPRELR